MTEPVLPVAEIQTLFEERELDRLKRLGGCEGIGKILDVDLMTGHKSNSCRLSDYYGRNVMPEKASPTLLNLMWSAYKDKTLILLTIAAVISLIIGVYEEIELGENGWIEGLAILSAIIIVVFVNSLNDYWRERQFRMLSAKVKDRQVNMLFEGHPKQISVFDVTVGDILLFEPGEVLPADGLLIEGHKVTIDESGITGESNAIRKDPEDQPWMLSGSKVIDGSGKMLVLAVGTNSSQGRLVEAMNVESSPTPLQRKLDFLADQIAKAGAAISLLMATSLIAKFIIQHSIQKKWPIAPKIIQHILQILIQSVTILVVAVPEGLPMAVTMALAYATTKMLSDNNLVRVMASCETMGAATTICSDKTGTMTENKMTVVKYDLAGVESSHANSGTAPVHDEFPANEALTKLLAEGIGINSTAFMSPNGWIGSKTEVALLNFSSTHFKQSDYMTVREKTKVIQRVPFSSERKCMITAVEAFDDNGGKPIGRIYLKGASEIVLSKCSEHRDGGEVKGIDGDRIRMTIHSFAKESLRTIGLAYKDVLDTDEFITLCNSPERLEDCSGYCWLGVVGIEDPLRAGVQKAVRTCQNAGIIVRMVTGDNLETAKAIAKKAGVLSSDGIVIEGSNFRRLDEMGMRGLIPKLRVLARSSPLDKQVLVRKLKEYGEIVAVTGDGTNDGPALKAADVGFSMGIAGTEVAKEASSIVLMDDNFASIVKAVSWGRSVNDAVKKHLQFQLTVNLTAVITSFISALVDKSDRLAALALATDPPSDDLLRRPPDNPAASLVTINMRTMIIGQSVAQIITVLTLEFAGKRWITSQKQLRSFIFNTFIFLQLFNEVNCRSLDRSCNFLKGLSRNLYFVVIWVGTVLAQILIISFGGKEFGTVPLSWKLWLISVSIGTISLLVGIVIRLCLFQQAVSATSVDAADGNLARERWHKAVRNVQRSRAFYNAIRREHQLSNIPSSSLSEPA